MKFRGVRFTSKSNSYVYNYAEGCKKAGLQICAIITGESEGYILPQADYIEFWNEPDVLETYQTPQWLADNYVLYRNTYPQGFKWFASGFASGDPTYAKQFLDAIEDRAPKPHAISIHPYAKNSKQAAELIDEYHSLTKLPIVATEWYQTAVSMDMWDFATMLNDHHDGRCRIWNSYFCLSDAMVPPFGLTKYDGFPKDEYYSLLSSPSIP